MNRDILDAAWEAGNMLKLLSYFTDGELDEQTEAAAAQTSGAGDNPPPATPDVPRPLWPDLPGHAGSRETGAPRAGSPDSETEES